MTSSWMETEAEGVNVRVKREEGKRGGRGGRRKRKKKSDAKR